MKFKVGDKVKLIANSNRSQNPIGFIGIIAKTDSHGFETDYNVTTDGVFRHLHWSKENEIELVEEEFVLPEKWAVRGSEELRLWLKNQETLLKLNTNIWGNNVLNLYYPKEFPTRWNFYTRFDRNLGHKEITFEQFEKYVLKQNNAEEIKTGDKFYHISNKEFIYTFSEIHGEAVTVSWIDKCGNSNRTTYRLKSCLDNIKDKTWILIKEKTMEKEIIGYELKDPKNEKVALAALKCSNKTAYKPFIMADMLSYYVPKIKELGIMDWFEPVYKPEKSLPKINGYDGKIEEDYVVYGCARLDKEYFLDLINNILALNRSKDKNNRKIHQITLDSGVTITIKELEQIKEYLDEK